MRSAFLVAALLAASALPALAQVKVVSAEDLFAFPDRYDGKTIKVRNVACIAVDEGDVRCVTGRGVAIFAEKIEPAAVREVVEKHCTGTADISSRRCVFAIEFEVAGASYDRSNPGARRLIVRPDTVTAIAGRR